MGLFDKRPPCAICGGKVKGLLPWKIEGNYICDDCHGVIDAQNGNDFTMEQFLKYRDFREQNQALREQFRVDEIVEFGFLSEKFVFDYEHSLFCMDKNLNKTIFHGSELKSFMISEDGAPLLEGSAKGFIHHESRVPQRIDELLPQVNQMLIQRQMQESMERLANRDKEVRPSYTSIDIPEPFKKFYIKLYLQHPYWSLYEFERTGPVIIGDVPDLNQYRIEYNESVQHLETLANALARVAASRRKAPLPARPLPPRLLRLLRPPPPPPPMPSPRSRSTRTSSIPASSPKRNSPPRKSSSWASKQQKPGKQFPGFVCAVFPFPIGGQEKSEL